MKPTALRLPTLGWAATMAGAEQIVPTIGPLSTSLEGCKLFIKTIIDAQPWWKEPSLLPFPWREEDFFKEKKLRIAVLWDDGVVRPHPPVTRALKQIVENLKAKGKVEIVDWTPYKHDVAWEIIVYPLDLSGLWSLMLVGKSILLRWRGRGISCNEGVQRTCSTSYQTYTGEPVCPGP